MGRRGSASGALRRLHTMRAHVLPTTVEAAPTLHAMLANASSDAIDAHVSTFPVLAEALAAEPTRLLVLAVETDSESAAWFARVADSAVMAERRPASKVTLRSMPAVWACALATAISALVPSNAVLTHAMATRLSKRGSSDSTEQAAGAHRAVRAQRRPHTTRARSSALAVGTEGAAAALFALAQQPTMLAEGSGRARSTPGTPQQVRAHTTTGDAIGGSPQYGREAHEPNCPRQTTELRTMVLEMGRATNSGAPERDCDTLDETVERVGNCSAT